MSGDAHAYRWNIPSSAYKVKSGDTLSAIAKKHGTTLHVLLHLNPQFASNENGHHHHGRNANNIRVGEEIRIPHVQGHKEKRKARGQQIRTQPDHHVSVDDAQDWLMAQARYFISVISPAPAPAPAPRRPAAAPATPRQTPPRAAPATPAPAPAPVGGPVSANLMQPGAAVRGLSRTDFERAASSLGIEIASIKAIADVESRGAGFFADNRPKILFERHIFHRQTRGAYDASHPDLSNATAGGYGRESVQWGKMERAYRLNPHAALMSASYGRFQVMGFNYQMCGWPSVEAFVRDMRQSEGEHLRAFMGFTKGSGLRNAINSHNWARVARVYNGSGYAKNKYDSKLRAAYAFYSR
jgi:N-acetylmuramidase/LysM domain